ncbi:hypothetical protein DMUE_3076 [Dictyocoela muelleri]|nr:hypothetical protein DMUE_3076 [Dictyocoela muelleri]
MTFGKIFYSFLAASDGSRSKPNQKANALFKPAKSNKKQRQFKNSMRNQIEQTAMPQTLNNNLLKGMNRRDVDVKIFMLCESRGFEELSLKEKFMYIIEKSDDPIQRWYFEMGSKGNLPTSFDTFLDKLKEFIKGKSLYQIIKYGEESWSEYISRLRSTCSISNKDDEDIISKLRRYVAPKVIRCIFYSKESLSTITQRVQELEDTDKFEKNYRYKDYKYNNYTDLYPKSQYKYEKIISSPNGEYNRNPKFINNNIT